MPSSGRGRTGSWPSRRETRRTGTAVRQERKSRREKEGQRCRTYSTVPVRRTRLRFRPAVIDSRMFPSSTGSPPSDLVLLLSFCLIRIGVRPRAGLDPRRSPHCRSGRSNLVSASPSPLPALLPLEKGLGRGGLFSGLRIASLVDGISALAMAERAGPSLSLGGGRTRGRDNRRVELPVNPLHVSTPMHRPSPSPLPVLLPPEKGLRGGGLCSGLRIASPVDGISAPDVAERAGPGLSLRGGRTRGRDNRRERSGRRRAQRLAVLGRTPNQCPGLLPLPVLLPPERGRRGGGVRSGWRITSPVDGISDL